ncbi:hypothetical protein RJT34_08159 [Clitoria ternatea]|uniref:Uncharacterized protein n=1 Tax=Clitoria ternatea TaxID=43366 RepID=A0AAN9K5Z6_CLITE
MDWFYPKRRGPEWKGTKSIASSVFAPSAHLLMIFGIVIALLSFSYYKDYKAQLHTTTINFHLFLFLLPVMLIFFMLSYARLNFHSSRP